jgi:hypothetical protein
LLWHGWLMEPIKFISLLDTCLLSRDDCFPELIGTAILTFQSCAALLGS